VKVRPVLADTGRASGTTANLLGAGWSFTTAIALPEPLSGWTLPQQALTIFVEASAAELNQPHTLLLDLVDEHGTPAYFPYRPDPEADPPIPVSIEQAITVPPVPGAPIGTPGQTAFVLDISAGGIWISAAQRRYIWRITLGDVQEEIGFWVAAPTLFPTIGSTLVSQGLPEVRT
jgi:hypothetical protein